MSKFTAKRDRPARRPRVQGSRRGVVHLPSPFPIELLTESRSRGGAMVYTAPSSSGEK